MNLDAAYNKSFKVIILFSISSKFILSSFAIILVLVVLVLSLLLFDDGECGNDNCGVVMKHCKENSNNIYYGFYSIMYSVVFLVCVMFCFCYYMIEYYWVCYVIIFVI